MIRGGEQPEVALDHRKFYRCKVVDRELVEPRRYRPALLQPADALLHHRPTLVRLLVELDPPVIGPLVLAPRDDRLDTVPAQPEADAWVAVALVARQTHP